MSRSNIILPPYPVQLGSIKFDSCEKQLHEYVKSGNYVKAKQMLKKGILPDSVNSLGQTPLFVAALLGLQKIVDLLLEYGSNPNQRCFDLSTPVHAAAFSCNQWIMSQLIDAGGDLRLHDEMSRRPYDWAIMAGRDQHAQMLEFIDKCCAHMHVLTHGFNCKSKNIVSSQELINSSSLIERLSPRKVVKSLAKDQKCKSISVKRMCSFGYGELFLIDRQVGFIATVPLIEDKSVVQDDCKPAFCYAAGPYTTMTNLMWGCTEVTVKGLKVMTHENCSKERFADLLIEEQKNISNLHHPFILHLLAVCTSSTLERTSLVFERINFGSLYHILHEKRSECPILPMETILNLLLQAIDALMFLHWRGFVHCSFSSHAIQVVSAGQAKISHFEYMIQSNDGRTHNEVACFPIPDQLYRWSSPEIILRNSVTMKSDLYSFCAVMQESLTDCLPWNGLDAPAIKHAMVSGRYLEADPRLFKPFYTITDTGLQARPKKRTINLQDIKYLIKNALKDAADRPTQILSVNTERVGGNSIQHAQQPCPVELETETMYKIAEEADTEDNYTLPENKGLSTTEDFEKQNFISSSSSSLSSSSSSSSSSQHYAYETSLNFDLEEDTDYESSEPGDTWQMASQRIEDGLTSILAHQRSTLNNLLYIQEFIPMSIMALHDEGETFQQPENVQTRETTKCFPHTSTDEVDGTVPQFSSKSYAGCSAVAPPQLHYVPPDIASDSRNVFVEAQKAPPITQSECFGGTRRKTIPKNGKTPQNPVTTQIYTCVASNMSGNSESEDDALFGKRYDTTRSSTQQLPTISFYGHRKAPDWSSRRCPSPVDEESCVTVTGIIPPAQDTFKDTDDSSETSYFTPELELSVENSQEKHLSAESNKRRGQDTPEQSSSDHSESSILTTEERNQTVCYARNRTFEKDAPIVTTFSSSPDSRSIIDVEGLSTILLDLKSPAKHFTPLKSTEASTRHSTPVNQATCSKLRPLQEEKSLETSCWESLKSYKSTKSSVHFLSAEFHPLHHSEGKPEHTEHRAQDQAVGNSGNTSWDPRDKYDVNSVDRLQEKVTDVHETFIKNQGLVCIVGSLENSEGNNLLSKTDCECQSMDITSLSSENEKTNNYG